MKVNRTEGGLLVRAEPMGLAKEISQRMVDVVRVEDGALLLKVDSKWARAINTVPVTKGVRVNEIRKEAAAAARLIA